MSVILTISIGGFYIMKKKLFLLLTTLTLLFAFGTVSAYAAESPTANVLPGDDDNIGDDDDDTDDNDGDLGGDDDSNSNKKDVSPKTGIDMTTLYVAVIGAAGVALIAKKKLSEEN